MQGNFPQPALSIEPKTSYYGWYFSRKSNKSKNMCQKFSKGVKNGARYRGEPKWGEPKWEEPKNLLRHTA